MDASGNVTLLGNTFNIANKLVQLDGSGKLPAIDGSALTNLPGDATSLKKANNLSDLTSSSTARINLGIGNVENTALSTWIGSTSLTTVGTLIAGTWNGSTIDVAHGGTGQTSYTNGQLLIGNTTGNTLAKATLTAGSGITITNGAGSITIAASSASSTTILAGNSNNANTANNDFFAIVGPGTGTTDSSAGTRTVMSHGGTVKNLYVVINPTSGSGKTNTYTVYKNGVATSLAASVTNSTTGNDTSDSFTIVAGDELSVKAVTQTNAKVTWSVDLSI